MRKRIKATGFSDWDSMFYNNLLSIPVLLLFSFVIEDWGSDNLNRNLCVLLGATVSREFTHMTPFPIQPTRDPKSTSLRYRVLGGCRGRDFIHDSMVHSRDK